jgi:hypothetical protein
MEPETTSDEQSHGRLSWAELLEAYRTGPRQRWSAELIERLGPWLCAARRQLHPAPPYLDQDDITQSLVLEVLRIASRWRPVCEDRWIPRRLVERAGRRIVKSLLAEQLDQALELDAGIEAPEPADEGLVFDTPVGKATAAELRLIYRVRVLGEPIDALAGKLGLTQAQAQRRLKYALERARAEAPEGR